jgi:hypothetical protein
MSQIIPIYIPTYIGDQNYSPNRVLPRLLFYNGLLECEEYYIESGSLTTTGVPVLQDRFPYFDNYNVVTGSFPTTDSDSLLFNNEAAAYGEIPTGSLYTNYWETYVNLLYNPRTRLFNCEAIIPLADYYKMELNDIVEWRGNYYHLRAINEYNLKNGECKIQLLGPLEPPVISNLLPEKDCGFNFTSSLTLTTSTTTSTSTTSTTTLSCNTNSGSIYYCGLSGSVPVGCSSSVYNPIFSNYACGATLSSSVYYNGGIENGTLLYNVQCPTSLCGDAFQHVLTYPAIPQSGWFFMDNYYFVLTGSCGNEIFARDTCPPPSTTTTTSTTSTTTSTTSTSTTAAYVEYQIDSAATGTSAGACSGATTTTIVYASPGNTVPFVGMFLYTNTGLTTPFVGSTGWRKLTGPLDTYAVEINTSGEITNYVTC